MEELKKCPYCGGKAVFETKNNSSSHHGVGFEFEIKCEDCGAKLPKRYKVEFSLTDSGGINPLHDDRKRAVEDWNKRFPVLQRPAEPYDYRLPHHAETAVPQEKRGNVGERCGIDEQLFAGGSVEVVCGEMERGNGK